MPKDIPTGNPAEQPAETPKPAMKLDLAEMTEAIRAAWPTHRYDAATQPALYAAIKQIETHDADYVQTTLHLPFLFDFCEWLKQGQIRGHDLHALELLGVRAIMKALTYLIASTYARRGEAFVPARSAILMYAIAITEHNNPCPELYELLEGVKAPGRTEDETLH